MKFFLSLYLCAAFTLLDGEHLLANSSDTSHHKLPYPNNIKLNLTSMIEFSPSVVVAYERTVFPSQTFSVMAGYVTFPVQLGSLPDSIKLVDNKSHSGFRVGADYRFYLKKENKYEAPHGLYWGPFVDYFYFKNERTISVTDTSFSTGNLDFTGSLQIIAPGVQIGYQFVIKKRLSIDMTLFGPALAFYTAKLKLGGNFDINQENQYLQALYNFMISNFPFIGELANGTTVTSSGRADVFFAGFRYSICAGFRF